MKENYRSRVAKVAYFGEGPDRASNDWHRVCDHLLVLGTPRVNPADISAWLTVHGQEVLGDGTWQNGAYQDPRWQEGHAALCTSALLQAIGRARSHLPEGRGENPGRMADRTAGFYRAEGWGREGCPLGRWKKRRMR